MIDINLLKTDPGRIKKAVKDKRADVDVDAVIRMLEEKSDLLVSVEELRKKRNEIAEQVKNAGKPTPELIAAGKKAKDDLEPLEKRFEKLNGELTTELQKIPNLPSDDTPIGPDEESNKVQRQAGNKPVFSFLPKEHWELGEALGVIDSERAAKVTGTRFSYIKGKLALLEFALIQHTLKILTDEAILAKIIADNKLTVSTTPFIPVIPPVFIRPDVMQKMARLEPKEERYHIASDDLYLIGSAEHTLGPMHMDETLPETELPIRYAGFSTSFRREAGSYGKDTKGILRLHQFDKVEMESFSVPELSTAEQDFLVAVQEHLVQSLGLPYQVVIVSTGDQGSPDARQIDIETWMPGQDKYRETHSADLNTDYQARRLNTRVHRLDGSTQFVHTNDATAFAIGRTLIAIMENYQREDGSIAVPEALVPYCGFTEITAQKSPG